MEEKKEARKTKAIPDGGSAASFDKKAIEQIEKEESPFGPNEILEPLGFVEKPIPVDNPTLLAFFQMPLYEKPKKVDLNASVTAGNDVDGSYLLVFDFEVTVYIEGVDVHIGSYDIVVTHEHRKTFSLIFKSITTFISQSAKLYVATQALLDRKRDQPN